MEPSFFLAENINTNAYRVNAHNWNSPFQPNILKNSENLTEMEPQNYVRRGSVISQSKTQFFFLPKNDIC